MDVWCFDNNYAAGISYDGVNHVELGDPELLNSSSMQLQMQFDELDMLMESIDSTCQVSEDIFQHSHTGNFLQTDLCHNSSLQIPNQLSLPFSNRSCSTDSSSSNYMMTGIQMQPASSTVPMNQHCDARFSYSTMEEIAIAGAMLCVLSSSSSSSSPSYMPQSQKRAQNFHSQTSYYQPKSYFQPYSSLISSVMEIQTNVQNQNMMKRAHNMLRNIDLLKAEGKLEEIQPSAYQKQHMVSERKRRERLNASFHSLWQLLPPGSKKDKASVLSKTMSYVKTLQTEIYELEERNRILEEHILPSAEVKEHSISPNGRVEVQINKSEATSEAQLIDLVIKVRVQCDLIRVVLHVLECIKAMRAISLLSLDARPNSQQMKLLATLKLAFKGSTWDERTFKEAVSAAAHMALKVT